MLAVTVRTPAADPKAIVIGTVKDVAEATVELPTDTPLPLKLTVVTPAENEVFVPVIVSVKLLPSCPLVGDSVMLATTTAAACRAPMSRPPD